MQNIKLKILLTLFVLLFSSLVFADDISDFQIEGISIGDSLLDYFSEEDIKNKMQYTYEDNGTKEIAVIFYYTNLKIYDAVQISFKTEDHQLTIVGIMGDIYYPEEMEECLKKKDQVANEIKLLFKDADVEIQGLRNHSGYPIGQMIYYRTSFFINNNERSNLEIFCYDVSEDLNITDSLTVSLKSKEYNDWLVALYNN